MRSTSVKEKSVQIQERYKDDCDTQIAEAIYPKFFEMLNS